MADENTHLIVGLGNPGRIYEKTRHNIGFQCVDYFAQTHGLSFGQKRAKADIAMGRVHGLPLMLTKPQTYMNLSGTSVREIVRWYKVPLENVLVVYDDMDLPFGIIRIREQGTSGGHKGLQSIVTEIGTNSVPRLRVGIGRPELGDSVDHVLNNFNAEERKMLPDIYKTVSEAIDAVLQQGLTPAMNLFNGGAK